MSISARHKNSQLEPLKSRTNLRSFVADLTPPTLFNLLDGHLPLLLSLLPPKYANTVTISKGSSTQAQQLKEDVAAWYQLEGKPRASWHILGNPLSEQEREGIVATKLTNATHYFLNQTINQHFIVPENALDHRFPSPQDYKKNTLSLHTGENCKLNSLIATLVRHGFERYNQNVEPGGLSVRGENIVLWHPLWPNPKSLTFLGSTIEQITNHAKRPETITSLTIPPIAFPAATTPLSKLIINNTALKIGPQYLQNDLKLDITTDALNPNAELPIAHAATWEETSEQPSNHNTQDLLASLTIGQPVVHADHGIGIYEGLQSREINGTTREYLIIRYAAGDTLSVPVEVAYKLTPYVGETEPQLHRLGGTTWAKQKRAANKNARLMARELVTTARERATNQRTPYTISPELEAALESNTPYELTPDQHKSWQEIKSDLAQDQPMDRLLVGDVGFGKTEIALRTAQAAIANGRQVALLAPTTLLVQQHFDTFSKRLDQPVGMLSRFTSGKQQRETREKLASGELRIAIGTHALLSQSTQWKNLGLVIIDEEQRFGVTHKEHFKKLRATTDILSLSATPIPRSLFMSLSGLRTLSVITTPPTGRQGSETIVAKDSDKVITAAVNHELQRDGQIYVVAPLVRNLNAVAHRVQKLAPKARVAIIHGQLSEKEIATTMHSFDTGETDILISSTIIANGLDLPNANTMIVLRATHFGLSTLYQLRGRIGRRQRLGHAYFLYNQDKFTPEQRQRLAALTETARLGSGWQLARRDLEIRGAGNLLGSEQSGHIENVGLQFYLDLVGAQSDESLREHGLSRDHVEIELPIIKIIPPSYIENTDERSRWYHKLTRAKSAAALGERQHELEQTHGTLPPEAQNLILTLQLQHIAADAGITKITHESVQPPGQDPFARLVISGSDLPNLLNKASALGHWEVRDDTTITLDSPSIDPELLKHLATQLR